MRVYDQNSTGATVGGAERAKETQRTGGGPEASAHTGNRGDRVELSTGMGSLSRALASDEAGRATRLQELAAQYQAGSYHPDAAETGRAMLADAYGAVAA